MKQQDFFPLRPQATPKIYAYSSPSYPGLLKVGETKQDVATRVKQQFGVKQPIANPFTIELEEIAMRSDGTSFNDHDVHAWLRHNGIENPNGEWFKCNVDKVKAAIIAVRERSENIQERTWTFDMRPEQKRRLNVQPNISRNILIKRMEKLRIFYGIARCDLAKRLQHTN